MKHLKLKFIKCKPNLTLNYIIQHVILVWLQHAWTPLLELSVCTCFCETQAIRETIQSTITSIKIWYNDFIFGNFRKERGFYYVELGHHDMPIIVSFKNTFMFHWKGRNWKGVELINCMPVMNYKYVTLKFEKWKSILCLYLVGLSLVMELLSLFPKIYAHLNTFLYLSAYIYWQGDNTCHGSGLGSCRGHINLRYLTHFLAAQTLWLQNNWLTA